MNINDTTASAGFSQSVPLEVLDQSQLAEADAYVQARAESKIQDASEAGKLMGAEAPTWETHYFEHHPMLEKVADAMQRQFNHMAESLGLLGVSIKYKAGAADTGSARKGSMQIRLMAEATPEPATLIIPPAE